ncbi:Edc1p [Saccharomyces cerevisiae x Saccharomyces kudriavzevii VIN7]|uniref:Edc1p n=1 Tax=Saccharomyces cerevisiae x Saccharomyces kudriavzevii (strain VIN7) TaxID=1095631 RepID=H0GUI4_SACCK|nr:Edc1p [Saccharomyces cerevisiae x Saccharomyces kudriavzevii VIN7]
MSTDTMYFNSSRLLPSAGKNKTNNLIKQKPRNNRASGNTAKNISNNTSTTDIPPPQTLPNGENQTSAILPTRSRLSTRRNTPRLLRPPLCLLPVKRTENTIRRVHDRATRMKVVYTVRI